MLSPGSASAHACVPDLCAGHVWPVETPLSSFTSRFSQGLFSNLADTGGCSSFVCSGNPDTNTPSEFLDQKACSQQGCTWQANRCYYCQQLSDEAGCNDRESLVTTTMSMLDATCGVRILHSVTNVLPSLACPTASLMCCVSDAFCKWNDGQSYCDYDDCSLFTTTGDDVQTMQQNCKSGPCKWKADSSTCEAHGALAASDGCNEYTVEADCLSAPVGNCKWTANACSVKLVQSDIKITVCQESSL